MKKIFFALLSVFLIFAFSACISEKNTQSDIASASTTPTVPVHITMTTEKSIYPPSIEEINAKIKNASNHTYQYGAVFSLERLNNSAHWEKVPFTNESWDDYAVFLSAQSENTVTFSLTDYFAPLKSGSYRLALPIMDTESGANYELCADFLVEE